MQTKSGLPLDQNGDLLEAKLNANKYAAKRVISILGDEKFKKVCSEVSSGTAKIIKEVIRNAFADKTDEQAAPEK